MPSIDRRRWKLRSAAGLAAARRGLPLAAALVLLLSAHSAGMVQAHAPRGTSDPELLKAAFVYNFAKFTRWPDGTWSRPSETFQLCTLGRDSLVERLSGLDGESVAGHPVEVRAVDLPLSVRGCHLLYLARQSEEKLVQLLQGIRGAPVLTVSQAPRFAHAGGMVELYRDFDRLRFRVNLDAARAAGLQLSARLLKLAQIVEGGGDR